MMDTNTEENLSEISLVERRSRPRDRAIPGVHHSPFSSGVKLPIGLELFNRCT
jgi:hypothetical protein